MNIAADLGGTADIDEVLDKDVALQRAAHLGALRLQRSIAAATLMDDGGIGRHLAFDIPEDLDLTAVANFALDDRVFPDHQQAIVVGHDNSPGRLRLGRLRAGSVAGWGGRCQYVPSSTARRGSPRPGSERGNCAYGLSSTPRSFDHPGLASRGATKFQLSSEPPISMRTRVLAPSRLSS